MSKKRTGIIIILFGLISLLAALYFMFFYSPVVITEEPIVQEIEVIQETKKEVIKPLPEVIKVEKEIIQTEQKREITKEEISQAELKQIAASFAERYGSFSNQSNFQNLKDLMVFMTMDMQERTGNYIEQSLSQRGSVSIYYGVSTKAVATDIQILDEDKGQAVILVKTVRQESTGTINNISDKSQNIEISLKKERGAWKVDDASWQ